MKRITLLLAVILAVGCSGLVTGCREKGPAEKVGEKIDGAAQKMKDAVDPPGPAEKAGRKLDKAVGED